MHILSIVIPIIDLDLLSLYAKNIITVFITGRKQVDKMVPEGLINIPMPTPLKIKKNLDIKVANDLHFETKMEEVKEDMNNGIKQQYKTSTKRVEESQPPNKSDDGFKGINLLQKNGRRVFIRSRL